MSCHSSGSPLQPVSFKAQIGSSSTPWGRTCMYLFTCVHLPLFLREERVSTVGEGSLFEGCFTRRQRKTLLTSSFLPSNRILDPERAADSHQSKLLPQPNRETEAQRQRKIAPDHKDLKIASGPIQPDSSTTLQHAE